MSLRDWFGGLLMLDQLPGVANKVGDHTQAISNLHAMDAGLVNRMDALNQLAGDLRVRVENIEEGGIADTLVRFPIDVRAYMGNGVVLSDVGGVSAEGVVVGRTLAMRFEFTASALQSVLERDRDNEGVLYLAPLGIDDLYRAGGYRADYQGSSNFGSDGLGLSYTGGASWRLWREGETNAMNAVVLTWQGGERNVGPADGVVYLSSAEGVAWPYRQRYGLKGRLTIPIP